MPLFAEIVICPHCHKDYEDFPSGLLAALKEPGAQPHVKECQRCGNGFLVSWHAISKQYQMRRPACLGRHYFFTRTTSINADQAAHFNASGFLGRADWQAQSIHERLCRHCDYRQIETVAYQQAPSWERGLTVTFTQAKEEML